MNTVATGQRQLMMRFRFAQPLGLLYREVGQGEPWQPEDIERALAMIRHVFTLAEQMSYAEESGGVSSAARRGLMRPPSEEGPRQRRPLQVVQVSIGSLEIVLTVGGVYGTAKVLRYVFDLIDVAFTIRPTIRKKRAVEEAERLEAEVRSETARQELVRLGAIQLGPEADTAPEVEAVDVWLDEEEGPPQLGSSEPDPAND